MGANNKKINENSTVLTEETVSISEVETTENREIMKNEGDNNVPTDTRDTNAECTFEKVMLKPVVTETVKISDGNHKGIIVDAFCYNVAEEKVMLKIKLSDGTVFVNPVTLDQLTRYPYSQLVTQINARNLDDFVDVNVEFETRSKSGSEFSYVKKIYLAN